MTMIEKVSKAIAGELHKCGVGRGEPWDKSDLMARAAIEAMREPTSDMLNATGLRTGVTLSIWWSMIDAAADKRIS